MAGIDDNVALTGDWGLHSPSPRTLFSRMLEEDNVTRSISEHPGSGRTGDLFPGTHDSSETGRANMRESSQDGNSGVQLTDPSFQTEQKSNSNSRGGLVERMAARAGFNAPRLNTESIRSTDLSLNSDIRSPYLTIPPGLSPTTLLDSPVFLANSLVSSMSERLRRRNCVVICVYCLSNMLFIHPFMLQSELIYIVVLLTYSNLEISKYKPLRSMLV